MISRLLPLVLATVVLASLSGCKSDPGYAGNWTDPAGSKLALNEDKTFTLSEATSPPRPAMAGKWSTVGSELSLETLTVSGVPKQDSIDKVRKAAEQFGNPKDTELVVQKTIDDLNSMKLTPSEDKKSLSLALPGETHNGPPVVRVFTRVAG